MRATPQQTNEATARRRATGGECAGGNERVVEHVPAQQAHHEHAGRNENDLHVEHRVREHARRVRRE